MQTTTARDHLNWATSRALDYYDAGDKKNAFASFLSDVTKHPDTAWIAGDAATLMLLEMGWSTSRSEFKRMMEGFAASDELPEQPHSNPAPANTGTEQGAMQAYFGALAGGSFGDAITAQESAGQSSFVNSDTLPSEMSREARLGLETAGVVFGAPVPGDDLFVNVTLPEGWTKCGTSHDMHSDLLDEKGRKRAGIFYKAAFYDRRADLHIVSRFSVRQNYDAADGIVVYSVKDGDNIVFSYQETYTGPKHGDDYNSTCPVAKRRCEMWLEENGFPDWANPGMYWD